MPKKGEFELLVKLSIGHYIPGDSVIHHLDPRVKLLMGLTIIILSIATNSLFALFILFLFLVGSLIATKVDLRIAFRALKPMIPFLLILALIQMFAIRQFHENAAVIWEWRVLRLTDKSLHAALILIWRFIVIVIGLSLFSFTTSSNQLIHGIEHLLRPLQRIGLPAHEFAMVMHISIRFLPILISETERLMMAQASRGADFGKGRGFRRFRKLIPLFVPMFIISLRHAESLAEAMEARCYMGGKERTHLVRLHIEAHDWAAASGFILLAGAVAFLSFIHIDKIVLNSII
jgi:energy-coupling factor transport system permease protein